MSALTDWLLEQIAEDERVALRAAELTGPEWVEDAASVADCVNVHFAIIALGKTTRVDQTTAVSTHMSRHDPQRVLVQCQTLRDLIERHDEAWEQRRPNGTPTRWGEHVWGGLHDALRIMARIYADRPGYAEAIK